MSHSCYKKWLARNDYGWNNSLVPLRVAAMKVMCQCYYIPKQNDDIFSSLFKHTTQTEDPELMKSGEKCLEIFLGKDYNQIVETYEMMLKNLKYLQV